MAAKAKYTIMVPTRDNRGNLLRDLATAAHHHLFTNAGIQGSYIEPGKKGNWRDDPQETFDHLVTYADDTPETESHVKQTASHIGDLANQWGVTVTKEGKDGPNLWIIDNPNYQEGESAHPDAIQPPVSQMLMASIFGSGPESARAPLGGDLLSYLEGDLPSATTGA